MANPLKLKALLIDLNGTLHLGSEPTRNAVKAIERLRQARIPFIFCSNSTKESSVSLLNKLNEMGFQAAQDELMTSLGACRQLVEERGLRRPLLLMSPSAKEEFSTLSSSSDLGDYDSVILGLHPPSLSYESLNKAFRVLKGEPITPSSSDGPSASSSSSSSVQGGSDGRENDASAIPLIAPHAAMFQQSSASSTLPAGLSLGIGPFVRGLEEAAGVKAEIVGKPTARFFQLALERLQGQGDKLRPTEVGVVGDDVVNDLGEGARELGLKRILVRTGKYRPGAETANADHPPDRVYEDFAELVDELS